MKALTLNPLLQHGWRATELVINQLNTCSLYSLSHPNSSMKKPDQALNTRVHRRASARGYFTLVAVLPFISIPSCHWSSPGPAELPPTCTKTTWTPGSPRAADHFPSSLWSQRNLFISLAKAHTALEQLHMLFLGGKHGQQAQRRTVWWVRFNTVI